jgi:hypothetical protein
VVGVLAGDERRGLLNLDISWTQLYALVVVVSAVGLVRAISWLRHRRDEQTRTASRGAR